MRGAREVLDEYLVLSCQNGDETALELLARRWNERLLGHAFRVTGDPDQAAEAVQEAWIGIVRGIRGLDDPRRFGAWALAIVRNKCRDGIRGEVRRRRRADRLSADPTATPSSTEDVGPDAEARRDRARRIRRGMAELSDEQRAIVRLFYVEDRPVAEIADVLGLPVGTVKSRLFYARRRLKETLGQSDAPSPRDTAADEEGAEYLDEGDGR